MDVIFIIYLLKYYPLKKKFVKKESLLATDLFGYKLSNPLGLAAGFDKNGDALQGLLKLNFSFIEIGTVTPYFQKGNEKPRVFRIAEEKSILNKLGFPNKGAKRVFKNIIKVRKKHPLGTEPIIGVNIGHNKNTSSPVKDYVICLETFFSVADYITVNISSPNTPGLRRLQYKTKLEPLLRNLDKKRKDLINLYLSSIALIYPSFFEFFF